MLPIEKLKGYQNTTPEANGKGKSVYQNGDIINIFDIDVNLLSIPRIALSLSRIVRYCGNSPMTVAQHCHRGAEAFLLLGFPILAYTFLHHESATEPIFESDIPGPMKALLTNSDLKAIETQAEIKVFGWLGVEFPFPKEIKIMDANIASDEMSMMKTDFNFDYWNQEKAYDNFISMHNKLKYYINNYESLGIVG